jgi:uncharacterized membrane protein YuzA (DUF378 family)
MEENSNTTGILSIVFAILSFVVGMFILQIAAILLGTIPENKTSLHYIGIGIAIFSLFADLYVLGM